MSIDINIIPQTIRNSNSFSPENIRMLASVEELPHIDPSFTDERLKNIVQYYSINPQEMEKELHIYAAEFLNEGKIDAAWQILLSGENF